MVLGVVLCEEAARSPLGWKAGRKPVGAQTRSGRGGWAGPVGCGGGSCWSEWGRGVWAMVGRCIEFGGSSVQARARTTAFDRRPGAMRLMVDPPRLRDDLLEFLRGSGCLALAEGSDAIETQLLNSVSDRHDRAVLAGLVESWRARYPEARVDVVSS